MVGGFQCRHHLYHWQSRPFSQHLPCTNENCDMAPPIPPSILFFSLPILSYFTHIRLHSRVCMMSIFGDDLHSCVHNLPHCLSCTSYLLNSEKFRALACSCCVSSFLPSHNIQSFESSRKSYNPSHPSHPSPSPGVEIVKAGNQHIFYKLRLYLKLVCLHFHSLNKISAPRLSNVLS